MVGLKSFRTAQFILSGIEAMQIMKKGQLALRDKFVYHQAKLIHQLFGMAA